MPPSECSAGPASACSAPDKQEATVMHDQQGNRAVVLGGGMAGLLAARVLSDKYADVVVVDRDELTGVTEARKGVPHGRHAHCLVDRKSTRLNSSHIPLS